MYLLVHDWYRYIDICVNKDNGVGKRIKRSYVWLLYNICILIYACYQEVWYVCGFALKGFGACFVKVKTMDLLSAFESMKVEFYNVYLYI